MDEIKNANTVIEYLKKNMMLKDMRKMFILGSGK